MVRFIIPVAVLLVMLLSFGSFVYDFITAPYGEEKLRDLVSIGGSGFLLVFCMRNFVRFLRGQPIVESDE